MGGEGFIIDANNRMKQNRTLARRVKERNFQQMRDQKVHRHYSHLSQASPEVLEAIRKQSRRSNRIDGILYASIAIVVVACVIGFLLWLA